MLDPNYEQPIFDMFQYFLLAPRKTHYELYLTKMTIKLTYPVFRCGEKKTKEVFCATKNVVKRLFEKIIQFSGLF